MPIHYTNTKIKRIRVGLAVSDTGIDTSSYEIKEGNSVNGLSSGLNCLKAVNFFTRVELIRQ